MIRSPRSRAALIVLIVGAMSMVQPVAVPANTLARSQAPLHRQINRFRAEAHMPTLPVKGKLSNLARRHSVEMARINRLIPKVGSGDRFLAIVERGRSLQQVLKRITSGKNRRRVLTPTVRGIGAAIAPGRSGLNWVTVILKKGPEGVEIPSSIPADCSRDVTDDINGWMASVPNDRTLVFGWKGCYRTERTLLVEDRIGLAFEGNRAVFKRFDLSPPELRYPKANPHWRIIGGSDITIGNMRVEGTNTSSDTGKPGFGTYLVDFEFEHAFSFHGVQDVVVVNASADAIWGDGLYFAGGDQYTSEPTVNARVSGFTVDRNGRMGVSLCNIDGGLFEDIHILHSRRAGFDLEPPPGNVRNIEIRNSYTNTHLLAFASGGVGDVSNIEIHHNVIEGVSVPWVYVKETYGLRRHDWSIHDNRVIQTLGSPAPMLLFVNVDNVDVRRNVSHATTTQSRKAVEFVQGGGSLFVIDNDFTGACNAYVKDVFTGPVTAYGNTLSPPESC
jgi:hypothetical protein